MENEDFDEDSLFIVAVEQAATVLCERHAQAYAEIMASLDKEFTIVEMMPEDASQHYCMACNMQDELTRPRIILPH